MAALAVLVGVAGVVPGAELIGAWRPLGPHEDEAATPDPGVVRKPAPTAPVARYAEPTPPGQRAPRAIQATPTAPSVSPSLTAARSRPPSPPVDPHAGPLARPEGAAAAAPTARVRALENAVVRLTNTERVEAGCAPLRVDPRLRRSARRHSRDMARRDYVAHVNPEGETPGERMAAEGYPYGYAENIAWGYRDARATVDGWMGSPGHRHNILDCANTTVGVGVYMSPEHALWTQDFGRE